MLHILHAADLHLDAPFAALSAEQARERRAEQRLLLDKLADAAIERGADLVLLSGDLLDSAQTYRETAQALAAALGRIPAPVAIAPGNHDFYTPSSLYAADIWPDNVLIFKDSAVQRVELSELTLYGAAFTSPFRDTSPLAGFTAPRTDKPTVMAVHGDVDGKGRYGSISREDIAQSGLTYLALGHIHACSGLQREGNTYWAYPGCTEGRGFDELGDKGVLAGTVEPGRAELRFVPLCRRRYHILETDVTGRGPREALEAALPPAEDLCRIIFTGEAEGIDLAALETAFRDRVYALELRDKTRPAQSLWARAGEDTLRGLFLQEMRYRYDAAPSEAEREKVVRAVRFGLAAIEGRDL